MKISAVTPVLNGERFIRQTIESVLSQEGNFKLEYIIQDGGSTDDTLSILSDYENHPAIRLVSQKDRSFYDAINQGFENATGEIGCWINADDYYRPGAFQKVIETFQRNRQADWLYGRCDIVNETGHKIRIPVTWYKNLLGWKFSYKLLLSENYINQPATFWRMNLWKNAGGLSLDYPISADYHLWLKFSQESKAIALHDTLACFRRCGESISDTQFEKQFAEELEIATLYSGRLITTIHRFNFWKIITAYKIMSKYHVILNKS